MKKILLSIILSACTLAFFNASASHQGRIGYSGGPQEENCTYCHTSFALNSGGGSVSIVSNMNNWQYTPGQTYTIALTVHQTGMQRFGMAFEANKDTGMIGMLSTMSLTDSTTTWRTRTITFEGAPHVKYGMTHSRWNMAPAGQPTQYYYPATQPDFYTWYFKWTAPVTDEGPLTFWFTGLACDSLDDLPGDYCYTSSQVITPTTPEVTVAPLSIIDFTATTTLASASQTATFSAQYLRDDFKIVAPDQFKVSLTGLQGSWVKRLTVPKALDASVPSTTVYIKYFPTTVGTAAAYVRLMSQDITLAKIRVKGIAAAKLATDGSEVSVTLSPNPAVNTVNLKFNNVNEQVTVSLFTSTGKLIQTQITNNSELNLDISMLMQGMYLCRIETSNGVITKMFTRQ